MTQQTVELAGKRFVIVEEKHYLKLVRQAEAAAKMTRQDQGDVAESKRRLSEPGASMSWEQIKAERKLRDSSSRRRDRTRRR